MDSKSKFDVGQMVDLSSLTISSLSFASQNSHKHEKQSLLQSDEFSEAVIHLRALASCVSDCESAVS